MLHKFSRGNVIQANRSGQQAVIVEVDVAKQQYVYQYLNPTSLNFQGQHKHSFQDIEQYWEQVGEKEDLFQEFEQLVSEGCKHKWKDYLGLNERFEYCSECNQKKHP